MTIAKLIAALSDGRPVQILIAAAGLLDQTDDGGLAPSRAPRHFGIVDAGLLDRIAIRSEVICRRRKQCLLRACQVAVGKISSFAVEASKLLKNSCFIPDHECPPKP